MVQSALFLSYRHRLAPRWRRKYGDVFTVQVAPLRDLVVVCRPEHVRETFAGPAATFHAGAAHRILLPVMGEHSLLILDGDDHLQARKRLMPAFNGAALRSYSTMMVELAERCAEGLPEGRPFAMHKPMGEVTLEIILRVVFGMADGPRLERLRPLIHNVMTIGPVTILGWSYPKLQGFWPWRRNRRIREAADALIYAEIADRRRAGDLASRTDVLSRLLTADPPMSDVELRDHMVTLLLAGHETTATALAWSFHDLARNPEVLRKATAAAHAGDDDYLAAVAKEAMRLRPVIYGVARKLAEDTEIAGRLLPAGAAVMPSIGLVHQDGAVHLEPEEFRPERFVGAPPEAGTWIPFGGGVRRCIGAGFALQEATAVLSAVLRRYNVAAERPTPEPAKSRHVALVPRKGARVVLTRQ